MADEVNEKITEEILKKYEKLKLYIEKLGSVAIGFSGGVDSTFLVAVAHEVLGDKMIAITQSDSTIPPRELTEAKRFCDDMGIRHIISEADPLYIDEFRHNSINRCYYCKRMIFSSIIKIAKENGIRYVAEGSNMDDTGDYRPGMKAVRELMVVSPLMESGLYKSEIRTLSKMLHLPTWDKPAFACLASRVAYGEEITKEKLAKIDKSEEILMRHGFKNVRVRVHGSIARIEVPETDIQRLASDEIRDEIYDDIKSLGFMYVTMDMRGYSMGSMNRQIKGEQDERYNM